jgi:hypothetical protein
MKGIMLSLQHKDEPSFLTADQIHTFNLLSLQIPDRQA